MIQWCSCVFSLILLCLSNYVSGQFFNNRPYPTYSLESMPNTAFSCRDKILGGYYADAETQCQMFHVCVKVAGIGVQDFRFLCPNGTAFDQDSQICADWDDVDCEASTLYYSSDNFDLYRIGSGFETKAAEYAGEDESAFHLQRADTGDIRLQKENQINQKPEYNIQGNSNNQKVKSNQQGKYTNDRDIFRGSSSSNFFNNRNGGKEDDYENYDNNGNIRNDVPKIEKPVRKIVRRPTTITTTTKSPTTTTKLQSQPAFSNNQYNQQQTPTTFKPNGFVNARNQYRNQPINYSPTTNKPTSTTLTDEQYTTALNNYKARQQQGRSYNRDTSFRQKSRFSTNPSTESVVNINNSRNTNKYTPNAQYDNQQSTQYYDSQSYLTSTTPSYNNNYNEFRYSTPIPFEKPTEKSYDVQKQNIQRSTTTTINPFSSYYTNTVSSTIYSNVNSNLNYTTQQYNSNYYSTEAPFNYQQNNNNYNVKVTSTTVKPVQNNNYYNNNNQQGTFNYNENSGSSTTQKNFDYNRQGKQTSKNYYNDQKSTNYQDDKFNYNTNAGVSSTTQQYYDTNRQGKQISKNYYNDQTKSTNYQESAFNYNSNTGVSSTTQQYSNFDKQGKQSSKTYYNNQKSTNYQDGQYNYNGGVSSTTTQQYNNPRQKTTTYQTDKFNNYNKNSAISTTTQQYTNYDRQGKTYYNDQKSTNNYNLGIVSTTTLSPQYNNYDVTRQQPSVSQNYYNNDQKTTYDSTQYTPSYTKVVNNPTVKPFNTNDYYNYTTTEKYNNYNGQYNNKNNQYYDKPTTYNPKYNSRSGGDNDETLKTAHSINFASGRNENYNNQQIKSNTDKSIYKNESPRPFSVSRNSKQFTSSSTTLKPISSLQQTTKNLNTKNTEADDKSYDYAYYDSDSHFTDYDNIASEFSKTTRKYK